MHRPALGWMFPSLLCFSRPQTSNRTGPPLSTLSTTGRAQWRNSSQASQAMLCTAQRGQSRQETKAAPDSKQANAWSMTG